MSAVPQADGPGAPGSSPPTDAGVAPDERGSRRAKLSKEEEVKYSKLYGKQWRQLRRWVDRGEEVGDPCPLHDPGAMPPWWVKHMKWRVPPEIEQAALDAARVPASGATLQACSAESGEVRSSPGATMGAAGDAVPPAAAGPIAPKGTPPLGKSIDLESFDPEEGDRLRELRQIQAARFAELRERMLLGEDCSMLEARYLKTSEMIDKMETRVAERLKKRGLYILRADIERDLAANAELLRTLDASQERRVLERCSSLSSEQRVQVVDAIRYTNRSKERILAKLDSLSADDLLRDLRAA